MQVVGIRLQKLVHKDVERESFSVFEEHIVAFQIGFVVHSVHDHTVPAPALKEFFDHAVLYTEKHLLVKRKARIARALIQMWTVWAVQRRS